MHYSLIFQTITLVDWTDFNMHGSFNTELCDWNIINGSVYIKYSVDYEHCFPHKYCKLTSIPCYITVLALRINNETYHRSPSNYKCINLWYHVQYIIHSSLNPKWFKLEFKYNKTKMYYYYITKNNC